MQPDSKPNSSELEKRVNAGIAAMSSMIRLASCMSTSTKYFLGLTTPERGSADLKSAAL
jgi:hypothetical protein